MTSPHDAPPRPVLIVVHGPDRRRIGERFILPRGRELVLGRSAPAFPSGPLGDRRMSGRHAALMLRRDLTLELVDLGSKNGVVAQGEETAEAQLAPGDVFQLGRTFFQYRLEPPFDWSAADSLMWGVGHRIHGVREQAARAARHDQPVLILGPSGSGKEPTAREIHRRSPRGGAFVALNCAALPQDLVESELFGHAAGAFTGARVAKEGLFVSAQGGTLFLDELGTLPMELQPKLLRAIQDGRVRPVGSRREIEVDARIIAATNEDMVALVRGGAFREDLHARLCGAVIRTPPLSDHREDLATLAHLFLDRAGHRGVTLAPGLFWALWRHPWPLNVRELQHLILSAAPSAEGGVIMLNQEVRDLLALQAELEPLGSGGAQNGPLDARAPSAQELTKLLRRHKGVVARVARELHVHRFQVYRWMRAHDLDAETFRNA